MCKQIFHLAFILCLLTQSGSLSADLLLGAKAPDFQGRDLQGNRHLLSDYAGKIVVLEWSSPECPYSRRYYDNGTLDSLYEYAAKNGVAWINIVPKLQKLTPEQALGNFDTSKKIVILDMALDISTDYSATTTPQIFIIDRQGILAYSGAIDSNAMLKKTTGKLVPYTQNALDDLLAGRQVRKKITRAYGCYVKNKTQPADGLPQIIAPDSQ
ncbi:MAG: redoxin domain-containing protein [gamma proteobacterium endosymbiont of Lamellibrachia anaximandri]|nr:redoxin domain-containing protein [gamma proteobacterium endosymbiont of Lamellibrachia anaximandri]MBL3618331.1 redoxin domain-containing protein [gamma proteobacterium endosymbiont of Lamellibrachia anaximandri]